MEIIRRYDYLLVVLSTFFIYNITTRLMSGGDEKPMALLPVLILKYHTVFFDGLDMSNVLMAQFGSHIISVYPLVTPVLLLPLYSVFLLFAPSPDIAMIAALGKYSATILTAFSVYFFFLAAKRLLEYRYAVVTTVLFAFGTLVWSVCSQILLGHTTEVLLLTVLIYLVVRNEQDFNRNLFVWMGVVSALFFINRPSDSFMMIPIVYYMWVHRKYFAWFAVSCAVVALPFLVYNWVFFGALFGGYQPLLEHRYTWDTPIPGFFQNVAALLVSPSRGLFAFCPALLLAIPGVWYLYEKRNVLLLSFVPGVLLCIATYGLFHWWDGTGGYGPRYLTVIIPVLALYAGFGIARLWDEHKVAITGLIGLSVLINLIGALGYPWSTWDISARDYWGSSEIVDCFHAMLTNAGTNLKLFVFPPVDGGVIYGIPTVENIMVLAFVVLGITLIFILIHQFVLKETMGKE